MKRAREGNPHSVRNVDERMYIFREGTSREGEQGCARHVWIVARMEAVTGRGKRTVVRKYLELGRDEVATIDELGIKE